MPSYPPVSVAPWLFLMNVSRPSGGLEERKKTTMKKMSKMQPLQLRVGLADSDVRWCESSLPPALTKPINLYADLSNANVHIRQDKMVLSGSYGKNYRWGERLCRPRGDLMLCCSKWGDYMFVPPLRLVKLWCPNCSAILSSPLLVVKVSWCHLH